MKKDIAALILDYRAKKKKTRRLIIFSSISAIIITLAIFFGIRIINNNRTVNKDIDTLNSMIDTLRSNNTYFKLIDGQNSYETYVYNSLGECVAQGSETGYITVFLGNDSSVRYTDQIWYGIDIDALTLMKNTVKAVKDKIVHVSVLDEPENYNSRLKYYTIEFNGWDNIRAVYSYVSDSFADNMIKDMQASVGEGMDDVKLIFTYIVGDNKEFSAACELSYGGNKYTLWYIDGYLFLYDWKLPDEWHTYDFANGDIETSEAMLDALLNSLQKMFADYARDNNIEVTNAVEEDTDVEPEVAVLDTPVPEIVENKTEVTDNEETEEDIISEADNAVNEISEQ